MKLSRARPAGRRPHSYSSQPGRYLRSCRDSFLFLMSRMFFLKFKRLLKNDLIYRLFDPSLGRVAYRSINHRWRFQNNCFGAIRHALRHLIDPLILDRIVHSFIHSTHRASGPFRGAGVGLCLGTYTRNRNWRLETSLLTQRRRLHPGSSSESEWFLPWLLFQLLLFSTVESLHARSSWHTWPEP